MAARDFERYILTLLVNDVALATEVGLDTMDDAVAEDIMVGLRMAQMG